MSVSLLCGLVTQAAPAGSDDPISSVALGERGRGGPPSLSVIVVDTRLPRRLSREEIRAIYLRELRTDRQDRALVPVNLPATDPIRRAFSEQVFGRPPKALEQYWDEQYFQGVSPPFVLASPEAVIRFVAGTPGAVGYVPSCRVDARVRAVLRLPVPAALRRGVLGSCPAP